MDPITEAYQKSITPVEANTQEKQIDEGVSAEMDKVQMALESLLDLAKGDYKRAAVAFSDAIENTFVMGEKYEGGFNDFTKALKRQI